MAGPLGVPGRKIAEKEGSLETESRECEAGPGRAWEGQWPCDASGDCGFPGTRFLWDGWGKTTSDGGVL